MKTGAERILAERQRQIKKEGWSEAHDATHSNQELARAAECYFLSAEMTLKGFRSFRPPDDWPWGKKWWKPKTPLRDYVRAGALWMAEFHRLRRIEAGPAFLNPLRNKVQVCADRIDAL